MQNLQNDDLMDATALASFYAFPPNNYGYCGNPTFRSALLSYLSDSSQANINRLKEEIMKFPAHYTYLDFIAKENGLDQFSDEVVRAFWTGNSLLQNISSEAMKDFIKNGLFKGRPSKRVDSLISNLPPGAVPHHSFNSLYIHFVTDRLERSIENFSSCCISWGKVLDTNRKQASLEHTIVSYENDLVLKTGLSTVDLERDGVRFVSNLSNGDIVSVHWGMAVEKLNVENLSLLKKWTQTNINAINNSK